MVLATQRPRASTSLIEWKLAVGAAAAQSAQHMTAEKAPAALQ